MKLEDYKFVTWHSDAQPLWLPAIRLANKNKDHIILGIESSAEGASYIVIRTGLARTMRDFTDFDFARSDFHHFMFKNEGRTRLWNWLIEWRGHAY